MEFHTQGYNGYAVKYSPFVDSRLALASSSNFGLVGNGRLYILGLTANGIQPAKIYDTQDSVYDTAWSEQNENQIVIACGDGTVKLYDLSTNNPQPIANWQEHSREVYAVSWNMVSKDSFISSSWDGSIKLYSPDRPGSMLTLPTHSCTYSAAFSPHSPAIISSVTSDSHLRIFDLRTPASASNHLVHLIPIHGAAPVPGSTFSNPVSSSMPSEALTHDWNKYRDTVIATAGVDQVIRTFDIRNTRQGAVASLRGHKYAVRKLAWSPHLSDVLLSGSYDMSAKVWTDGSALGNGGRQLGNHGYKVGPPRELGTMEGHTEFVTGVDWCLFGSQGWVATASWDSTVKVWDIRNVIRRGA